MTVEIVDVSTGRVEVVEIRPPDPETVEVIGSTPGVGQTKRLDDLLDVDGATDGPVGHSLVKQSDGQWRPALVESGGGITGPLSYTHEQGGPSTVWLIDHGLPFLPSGIEVRDHVGTPHYPLVSWPDGSTVRLDFNDSVRGTARLS